MKNFRLGLTVLLLVTGLLFSYSTNTQAQTRVLDSLRQKLVHSDEDTNKVWTLNNIAWSLGLEGNYTEAVKLSTEALMLSEKLNYKTGSARAYNVTGFVYFLKGDYKEAMKNLSLSYYISKEAGNKRGIASASINMANVYTNQGDYSEALKTLHSTLTLNEELGDKKGIADMYNNIGIVQQDLGNFPEALKNYLQALQIREAMQDQRSIADCYNNIGLVYESLHNYDEAIKNHFRSLKIRREQNDQAGIAKSYNNLGIVYNDKGNYQEALMNHLSSLEIHKKLRDNLDLGKSYNNVGLAYINLKNYPEALNNLQTATVIRRSMEDQEGLAESFVNLSTAYTALHRFAEAREKLDSAEGIGLRIHRKQGLEETYDQYIRLDSAMGNYKAAYDHFKKYLIYHDSIFSEETSQKTLRAEMNFEFDKKQAIAKSEQERITALAAAESRKQRIIILSVSILLLLICAFAAFAYRSYRLKKRANFRLEIQKKNIDDSIRYAQRIQQAILPKALFLPGEVQEHFVLYLPKDIVSGDFYWRHQEGRELFFAAVDCTGHGVPGAMMSMLGYDLLEYAVKDKGLREPEEILHLLNRQIIEKLNGGNSDTSTDGMDLTLCRLNLDTLQLVYAGAKNDLFVISDNELQVLRVTKCAIGYSLQTVYTQATRSLKKNDEIFLLTDGYSDQKGGPQKKKFMLRKLKTLLMELSSLTCKDQQQKLLAEFEQWKGSAPQKDDILFVGFRI